MQRWRKIRGCCLQSNDFWYLWDRAREEPRFKWVLFNDLTDWFIETTKERSLRGSVNTLWLGETRCGKSLALLDFTSRLDPTFAEDPRDRITFRLNDLAMKLQTAKPGQYFMHDEVRKEVYGEGAKWILDEISNFLETKAVTGISIGFATPVKKFTGMLAGINFGVEVIGYNEKREISMGILKCHRGIEWGILFFQYPPTQLTEAYLAAKTAFVEGTDTTEGEKYAPYIAKMKTHDLWPVSSSISDYDTILWDLAEKNKIPRIPTGLRGKIAKFVWLHQKLRDASVSATPEGGYAPVKTDEFFPVLRDVMSTHLKRQRADWHVDWWMIRAFEGKPYGEIAEKHNIGREETVASACRRLTKWLCDRRQNHLKGRVLEEATQHFLGAETLLSTNPPADQPRSPQTLPALPSWRLDGGPGKPDVALYAPGSSAPAAAVNCKLLTRGRSGYEEPCHPEAEIMTAAGRPDRAYMLLVELGTRGQNPHPRRWLMRPALEAPHMCRTGFGESIVEWNAWLAELRGIVKEVSGG